jgi:hypothetical protein
MTSHTTTTEKLSPAHQAYSVHTITNCARCGRTHTELTFRKLFLPCEQYTHWAPCPHTHEPIMMEFTDD